MCICLSWFSNDIVYSCPVPGEEVLHHFQISREESKQLKDIEERLLAIKEEDERISQALVCVQFVIGMSDIVVFFMNDGHPYTYMYIMMKNILLMLRDIETISLLLCRYLCQKPTYKPSWTSVPEKSSVAIIINSLVQIDWQRALSMRKQI